MAYYVIAYYLVGLMWVYSKHQAHKSLMGRVPGGPVEQVLVGLIVAPFWPIPLIIQIFYNIHAK